MAEKYLTKEGLDKLKKELHQLETVERKKMAEKLNHAIGFGDLSENAAYEEAKEAQGFLEGRIKELRETIAQAKVIKKKHDNTVQIGSVVFVKFDGSEEKYQIVGSAEADILNGKISHQSPLGQVLLNKKKGDKVQFEAPGGRVEYKIIKVI